MAVWHDHIQCTYAQRRRIRRRWVCCFYLAGYSAVDKAKAQKQTTIRKAIKVKQDSPHRKPVGVLFIQCYYLLNTGLSTGRASCLQPGVILCIARVAG